LTGLTLESWVVLFFRLSQGTHHNQPYTSVAIRKYRNLAFNIFQK
jgi:hypothetical protein